MSSLVFTQTDSLRETPFTTSEIIAAGAGVTHDATQKIIRKYKSDLEQFGKVAFEERALTTGDQEGLNGFKIRKISNKRGRPEKIYHLNEQQATLLFTYLRNTPQVRAFKISLVRAFFDMAKELTSRQISRQAGIGYRKSVTDAIKQYVPESPNKRFLYKSYTDLAYKATLGMPASQYEKVNNIPKGKIKDYLTSKQLAKLASVEIVITGLLSIGGDYNRIKAALAGVAL